MLEPGQWTYSIDRLADVDGYELQVRGVRLSDCEPLGMIWRVTMAEMGGIPRRGVLDMLLNAAQRCADVTDGVSGEPMHPSDGT